MIGKGTHTTQKIQIQATHSPNHTIDQVTPNHTIDQVHQSVFPQIIVRYIFDSVYNFIYTRLLGENMVVSNLPNRPHDCMSNQ